LPLTEVANPLKDISTAVGLLQALDKWFPKWAVPPPGSGEKLKGGGEAEMGG